MMGIDSNETTLSRSQSVLNFGDGVLVYLQFAKVGSGSLRMLMNRWAGRYRMYPSLSVNSHLRNGSIEAPGRWPSHYPYVVQSKYGFCNVFWQKRPCTYFTLLRHPVARLKSAFDYFCRSCAENGRYCNNAANLVSRSGERCPNMSLLNFAHLEGNMYTHELSGAFACGPCNLRSTSEADLYNLACDDGALPIREYEMLSVAKTHLEAHVFPLILEELNLRALHAHLGYSSHMDMAGYEFPVKTHHPGGPSTSPANIDIIELQLLESILSLDMALYNYARGLAQRWSERLSVPPMSHKRRAT